MFGMQWHASKSQRNMAFVSHLHELYVMPFSSQMPLTRAIFLLILTLLAHHGIICCDLMPDGFGSTAKEQFHHLKNCIHLLKKSLLCLGIFWMQKQNNHYSTHVHGGMLE